MQARSFIFAATLFAASFPALAHDGVEGDHLKIGYYFGHDENEDPADPAWPATLLVDTHPWELPNRLFEVTKETDNPFFKNGWTTQVPGFEILTPEEQEFDGHGFYSWFDASYTLGEPSLRLHVESIDPGLQMLYNASLAEVPEVIDLSDGRIGHDHFVYFINEDANAQPGDVFTITFHLSDANGFLADSQPFTIRFGIPGSTCLADFNEDGARTVQDLLAYLSAFRARSASADMNGEAGITVQDLLFFLSAFRAGC